MVIGIDFDNTIVSYDELFHKSAVDRQLIPAELEPSKRIIRNFLRKCGKEEEWIELQGYAYGEGLREALPFPGVVGFFTRCRSLGLKLYIISHRTRFPFKGPDYDLHQAAHQWLKMHGFYSEGEIGLSTSQVYFELTKEEKLARIPKVGCTYFIDDLLEFLEEPEFPAGVQRVLFDPYDDHPDDSRFLRVISWAKMEELVVREGIARCGLRTV